ncbi:glycosyltransferase family 4 protein [Dasania sp. GY-MA-18]|uniref:Glycosyltransferase family 4 protein n=1 Tax=Dasania phycosphaerae TaxID=2950436 RepID=A0A9J6RJ96_9GAMM|nr:MULTISPECIES: glycosyltransferase family 4 protein [Dasania]MCR8922111.1 glycosyltransferase family 4 protein [Dasania sp. GY-MA-18]MCZ0864539.1 glycosyltransferase family 4 protein [Dasania phycosphaerae]MCZ0868267.1 glycosyltransferase family 4 protein [Dasania phycosphaerae]
MRIAFCLYKYFPYGGLQRDFLRFLQEAQNRGYQCRVYCISWQGEQADNIDLRFVPAKAWSNHRRNEKYARWVQQDLVADPVDIVFGFNKMPGLDIYYAADSCYEDKAKTSRGFLYRLGSRYKHFSRYEQAIFAQGQQAEILLISEIEKQKFIEHYHTEESRMHMLPPGISKDRCAPANAQAIRQQFRQEFAVAEDDNMLLFVGSGFIKKGLDRAITALAALPEAVQNKTHLFILGQDKQARFEQLARQLGVMDRVRFMAGRDDVPRFLLAADVLVHPALDEAAGIVLLEALVAGLPVLVTDVCGYAPFIADAKAGCVLASPFNQQAMNQQLQQMLDKAAANQWRENAIAYSQTEDLYSMHATGIDILEQTYQRLQTRVSE